MKKKVFLCILDGFSIGDRDYKYNAVFRARTPNFQRFLTQYPNCMLATSGLSVGLPEGQMGNSEVGHTTIGSGRVVYQDLPRIDLAIKDGSIFKNGHILRCLEDLQQSAKSLHLIGLCSNGGVHSHIDHIIAIAVFFAKHNVTVRLHLITDGRDVAPKSFLDFFKSYIEPKILPYKNIRPSTLCGRYYAMDRDNKIERTKSYFDLITLGVNTGLSTTFGLECFNNANEAIENSYNNGITDEFIKPCVIDSDFYGIRNGDGVLMANFRSDRARQIFGMLCGTYGVDSVSKASNESNFKLDFISHKIAMTHYSDEISTKCNVLFEKDNIQNTLAEVISNAGLKQLHIAETEKYAHVTFFFNGGVESIFKGEERILVPSPSVATYDLKPEMSLPQVTEAILKAINDDKYDFIACNVANGDMVGHSGNFEAAKQAAEHIDEFLGKMERAILSSKSDYVMLITADHGNLEEMVDIKTGEIHTQHTTGDVPLIYISKDIKQIKMQNGGLNNIAPTILQIMAMPKPKEMDESLLSI